MTFPDLPGAPRGVGSLRGIESFPAAAREALRDKQLRANLRTATTTIRAKRALAVDEVPDWQESREAGAAIKDEVLANLEAYLLELERNVVTRGGVVHWARDANEANDIVVSLVDQRGRPRSSR